MLAERRDARIVSALGTRLAQAKGHMSEPLVALRCLWGIHVSGGFDDSLALQLL